MPVIVTGWFLNKQSVPNDALQYSCNSGTNYDTEAVKKIRGALSLTYPLVLSVAGAGYRFPKSSFSVEHKKV